jgi:hypothetical protein
VFVIQVDGDTVRFLREYMDSEYAHSTSAGSGGAGGAEGHVSETLKRLGHDWRPAGCAASLPCRAALRACCCYQLGVCQAPTSPAGGKPVITVPLRSGRTEAAGATDSKRLSVAPASSRGLAYRSDAVNVVHASVLKVSMTPS